LTNKAVNLDRLGNYTGAISFYDKVLRLEPNNVNVLNNMKLLLNNITFSPNVNGVTSLPNNTGISSTVNEHVPRQNVTNNKSSLLISDESFSEKQLYLGTNFDTSGVINNTSNKLLNFSLTLIYTPLKNSLHANKTFAAPIYLQRKEQDPNKFAMTVNVTDPPTFQNRTYSIHPFESLPYSLLVKTLRPGISNC
jgi:hypothetical protein